MTDKLDKIDANIDRLIGMVGGLTETLSGVAGVQAAHTSIFEGHSKILDGLNTLAEKQTKMLIGHGNSYIITITRRGTSRADTLI